MYLITPIQRIPRYVLLLRDLFKHTPTSHPDYIDLAVACEKMEELASLVNRRKMESDRNRDVMRIQTDIYPPLAVDLVAAHRQLLFGADCELIVPKNPYATFITPTQSFARPLSNKVTERIRFSSFNPSRLRSDSKKGTDSKKESGRRDSNANTLPVPSPSPNISSPSSSSTTTSWSSTSMRVYLFNDIFLCCQPKSTGSYKPKIAVSTSQCAALAIDYSPYYIARMYTKPTPDMFETVIDIFILFQTAQLLNDFVKHVTTCSSKDSAATDLSSATSSQQNSSQSFAPSSSQSSPARSPHPVPSKPTPPPPPKSSPSQDATPHSSHKTSDESNLPEPGASTQSPNSSVSLPFKDGYIQKKGHLRHNWKTRFLRLEVDPIGPSSLCYYHDDQSLKPKGKILLVRPMHVAQTAHDTRKFCFSVFPDEETNIPLLTISVASQAELDAWIDLIDEAIDAFDDE